MAEEKNGLTRALLQAIVALGFAGCCCILWTAVVCVALWKLDKETLALYWKYLYTTWVVIASVWAAINLGAVIVYVVNTMRFKGAVPHAV